MRTYELAYLITSQLAEEDANALQGKVTSFIQEEGGLLTEEAILVRRKLAYPVKGQQQAYLASISFQMNPGRTADLEKKLKAETDVLRYLLLINAPVRRMPQKRMRRPVGIPKVGLEAKEKGAPKEKKVEIKDIEKKLEEILE